MNLVELELVKKATVKIKFAPARELWQQGKAWQVPEPGQQLFNPGFQKNQQGTLSVPMG